MRLFHGASDGGRGREREKEGTQGIIRQRKGSVKSEREKERARVDGNLELPLFRLCVCVAN